MLKEIQEIEGELRLPIVNFGHAGDGNIHVNVLVNEEEALPRAREAVRRIFQRAVALGGTLSGEHGIGTAKAPFLSTELGENEMDAMKRVKDLFDPKGILNPGKIFP